MQPRLPCRRLAFALIELLVIMFMLALLIALTLPLLQDAREKERAKECLKNLGYVAKCTQNYELAKRQFPGYSNTLMLDNGKIYTDPETGKQHGVGYIVMLLPYLDQAALQQRWKTPVGSGKEDLERARELGKIDLPMLICPSNPPKAQDTGPLSYAANCGMQDVGGTRATAMSAGIPRDWAENGVFFDHFTGDRRHTTSALPLVKMSNDYLIRADGTAQTCMLAENVDSGAYRHYTEERIGLVWNATGGKVDVNPDPPHLDPPDERMRINTGTGESELDNVDPDPVTGKRPPTITFARPSSMHAGGANMAFCDGKARFINEKMDYYVYCLLMSSNGPRARLPGTLQILANFNRPVFETWYLK